MRTAFIGLGVMGYPMAGHLVQTGHQVTVYNRTRDKAEQCAGEYGGRVAATPAEAASDAEVVLARVGRDKDINAVTLGIDGAFTTLRKNSVFVDCTTASALVARALAGFAPRSGGSDQPTKMVNQICLAGLFEALAEGLNFTRAAGLDPEAVVDVICMGEAQSWQMDNRHKSTLAGKYEHGFAVEWMRKDLEICFEEAARNGAGLPTARQVDGFYAEIEAMVGRRWDTSSLLARLEAGNKGNA